MDKSRPSEEKLLHILRNKDQPFSNKKKGDSKASQSSKPITDQADFSRGISLFSKFLVFISVLALGFLIYRLTVDRQKDVGDFLSQVQVKTAVAAASIGQRSDPKPFGIYAQQFKERDIFDTSFEKNKSLAGGGVSPMNNLKLTGVILGDDAEAIIEDVKTKQTTFLRKGDQINGADIIEILEGKVILSYDGQEYELKN